MRDLPLRPALTRLPLLAGAALLLGVFSAASMAQAQFYVGPRAPGFFMPHAGFAPVYRAPVERRMHPAMIVEELEDRGFRDLILVSRRPDVYVIEGMSPRREPVRLIVDAYDGEILERFARGRATAALSPLPTPPMRRPNAEAPNSGAAPKVAGPVTAPRATPAPLVQTAPAPPSRLRVQDWGPINSVPVAPLE